MEHSAIRYDENKLRVDLIPASITTALATVLTMGAKKYAERNWELGMDWDRVLGSLRRHLLAVENGEDFDKESGLLHASHILTNAAFLVEYYRSYPEGDSARRILHPMYYKNIGLDIDGVLADFSDAFQRRFDKPFVNGHYAMSYSNANEWEEIKHDRDFWLNIKPFFHGTELKFVPKCYITSRPINNEVTMEWLEKNGFPCVPCITVSEDGSKLQAAQDYKLDIFVDDKIKTYIELNSNGITCFLQDASYNRNFEAGHFRIFHPNNLFNFNLERIH